MIGRLPRLRLALEGAAVAAGATIVYFEHPTELKDTQLQRV